MNSAVFVDPAWDTEAEAAAQTYVDSLTHRLTKAGVDATGEVVIAASVADTIVRTAEERTADLIVMTSQALTGVARAFRGSAADAVVRTAHCPVLVIHRPATAKEASTANLVSSTD